ncbi:uncharacterized protein PgNI_09310 [Pyricularia grisea]|uniref:Mitochondrial pyruvate carrier n=1 Tax=Pyricularia grisea TaxID=148305 RepID=A0A6P8AU14_PYRGI|nr:uncharacterized protein PgNI_09310 [Pyricularia grisea]TLD05598.1 hypothetical protein PgNI_09310 [Pyricularia grisea]
MAAFVKSINARIRANKVLDYVCSTRKYPQGPLVTLKLTPTIPQDFWGPVSTFGIPIAAIADIQRAPADKISLPMTLALAGYSGVFMRFAFAVTPKNYLLFATHVVNSTAQVTQGYRYFQYHYGGGKERPAAQEAAVSGYVSKEEIKDAAAILVKR